MRPDELRRLRVRYVDFAGVDRDGAIVVRAEVVDAVRQVFVQLYETRFALRSVTPVDAYGADDDASMAADNTSGFNCRPVFGTTRWSEHSFGRAIDVNPVENPSVEARGVVPPGSDAYLDRSLARPGMAIPGSAAVVAFAAIGWGWGGAWSSPDYQHFSATGR